MPLNISKLGKILKETNRLEGIKEFNATLPVKIEVKKEINPIRYLINLGNKEIETKSSIPLIVGKKYFAELKEVKSKLNITNLKPIPEILETIEKTSFEQKGLVSFTKETILNHLANSQTKNEFVFFMNMLLAYQEKVFHLIINEKKKAFIQYRYKKNKINFYAVFNHLGEIEGEITEFSLTVFSPYYATLQLINTYADELNLKVITQKKDVKKIFDFTENLINLKV